METTQLIKKIRSGKSGRDQVIKQIYFDEAIQQGVKGMLRSQGADTKQLDALYNATIMEFVVTVVRKKDFEISGSLKSYLSGIAKYVWYKEVKKANKHRSDDIDEVRNLSDGSNPSDLLIDLEQKGLIHQLLSNLGKNCKEVLLLWANGYSMQEIAESMDYQSEGMARKKKYKCMKSMTQYVSEHPNIKNLLIR